MHKLHVNSFVISGVVGENLEFLLIVARKKLSTLVSQ